MNEKYARVRDNSLPRLSTASSPCSSSLNFTHNIIPSLSLPLLFILFILWCCCCHPSFFHHTHTELSFSQVKTTSPPPTPSKTPKTLAFRPGQPLREVGSDSPVLRSSSGLKLSKEKGKKLTHPHAYNSSKLLLLQLLLQLVVRWSLWPCHGLQRTICHLVCWWVGFSCPTSYLMHAGPSLCVCGCKWVIRKGGSKGRHRFSSVFLGLWGPLFLSRFCAIWCFEEDLIELLQLQFRESAQGLRWWPDFEEEEDWSRWFR